MLEEVKVFLGISDDIQDNLLNLIITDSEDRIKAVINQFAIENETVTFSEIPSELKYIQRDVAIKRFNKINSEGTVADNEEGRSFTWEKNYLDEYMDLLNNFTKPKKKAGKGIARFY